MKCMDNIRNRYYDGKLLVPEFSPVTDFSNAKCKDFIEGTCKRGGYCNYMVNFYISYILYKYL